MGALDDFQFSGSTPVKPPVKKSVSALDDFQFTQAPVKKPLTRSDLARGGRIDTAIRNVGVKARGLAKDLFVKPLVHSFRGEAVSSDASFKPEDYTLPKGVKLTGVQGPSGNRFFQQIKLDKPFDKFSPQEQKAIKNTYLKLGGDAKQFADFATQVAYLTTGASARAKLPKDLLTKVPPILRGAAEVGTVAGAAGAENVALGELQSRQQGVVPTNQERLAQFATGALLGGVGASFGRKPLPTKISPDTNIPISKGRVAIPTVEDLNKPRLFHGSADGLKIDEYGNINLGTKSTELGQFGKVKEIPTEKLKIKDFPTKTEMFAAVGDPKIKADLLKEGFDVVRAENHALGINPEKISEITGTKLTPRAKTVGDLETPKAAPEKEIQYAKNLKQDLVERETQARTKELEKAELAKNELEWEREMTRAAKKESPFAGEVAGAFDDYRKAAYYYINHRGKGIPDFAELEKINPKLAKQIDSASAMFSDQINPGGVREYSADDMLELFNKEFDRLVETNANLKTLRNKIIDAQEAAKEAKQAAKPKAVKEEVGKTEEFKEAQRSEVKAKAEIEPEVKVNRSQLPVGDEGKKGTSKLAERIKASLTNLSDEAKEMLSDYDTMIKSSQIKRAEEFVLRDPDGALAVLRGDRAAPEGLLKNSIYIALTRQAEGDVDLATQLAILASRRAGQEISILTELDPHGSVRYMNELLQRKIEAVGGREKVRELRRSTIETVKRIAKDAVPKKDAWASFLDEISC